MAPLLRTHSRRSPVHERLELRPPQCCDLRAGALRHPARRLCAALRRGSRLPGLAGMLRSPGCTDVGTRGGGGQRGTPRASVHSGKAWKEMVHRYLAGSLGLAILALALIAWRNRRHQLPVVLPTVLVGLVGFQALLGMWTVTLLVNPAIVTAHLAGGMATLALLWWLTLRQGRLWAAPMGRGDDRCARGRSSACSSSSARSCLADGPARTMRRSPALVFRPVTAASGGRRPTLQMGSRCGDRWESTTSLACWTTPRARRSTLRTGWVPWSSRLRRRAGAVRDPQC